MAIARVLIREPELLICDEPTSNLDHVTKRHIFEMLRNMNIARTLGRALLVATHKSPALRVSY